MNLKEIRHWNINILICPVIADHVRHLFINDNFVLHLFLLATLFLYFNNKFSLKKDNVQITYKFNVSKMEKTSN